MDFPAASRALMASLSIAALAACGAPRGACKSCAPAQRGTPTLRPVRAGGKGPAPPSTRALMCAAPKRNLRESTSARRWHSPTMPRPVRSHRSSTRCRDARSSSPQTTGRTGTTSRRIRFLAGSRKSRSSPEPAPKMSGPVKRWLAASPAIGGETASSPPTATRIPHPRGAGRRPRRSLANVRARPFPGSGS